MKDEMDRISSDVTIKLMNLHHSNFVSKSPHVSIVIAFVHVHQDASFDVGIDVNISCKSSYELPTIPWSTAMRVLLPCSL